MKIQTVLYYRYLLRQASIVLLVSIVLSLIVCLVFTLSTLLSSMTSIIVASVIWVLPLYNLVVVLIWFIKFKSTKSKMQNIELYERITNSAIRERVLKSGKRIKYLIPRSGQELDFFNAIKPEIDKQKELLKIDKQR